MEVSNRALVPNCRTNPLKELRDEDDAVAFLVAAKRLAARRCVHRRVPILTIHRYPPSIAGQTRNLSATTYSCRAVKRNS
jgi:hypothetical protein